MALDFLVQDMRYIVDVDTGLVQEPRRTMLAKGDKNANRLVVQLVEDGKPVDATGATASGRFIRPPDSAEVPLEGSVNGSEIIVTFNEYCYLTSGRYEADVILTVGEIKRTILTVTGEIHYSGSGAVVDVEGVIPSVDDIVAQLGAMKEAEESALAAAEAANTAAANASATSAKFNGLTVSAERADEADATVTEVGGVKHIAFKLPKGDKGDKGDQGLPGRDGTGTGTVTSVNGVEPDDWGNVDLGEGMWAFHVDENGHLICTYDTASPPPLSINEDGHLIYTITNGQTIDLGKVTA